MCCLKCQEYCKHPIEAIDRTKMTYGDNPYQYECMVCGKIVDPEEHFNVNEWLEYNGLHDPTPCCHGKGGDHEFRCFNHKDWKSNKVLIEMAKRELDALRLQAEASFLIRAEIEKNSL